MSIKLTTLLEQRIVDLIVEVSIDQLKSQFVDSGKIEGKVFDEISKTTTKTAYMTWLVKKVVDGDIKGEDVYKFKEYFDIFNRHKRKYPSPDINAYGKKIPIANFLKATAEIKREVENDPSKDKGVSRKKENKYNKFVIGNVDGFNVYKIPKGEKSLKGVACDLGTDTEWCTAHSEAQHFERYITKGPLYIFIKGNEKYQFHFESSQFMDKDDNSVISSNNKSIANFFKFLETKESTVTPDYFAYFFDRENFKGDPELFDGYFREIKEMFKSYLKHEINRGVEEYENYGIWEDKIYNRNPFKYLTNDDVGSLMMFFIEDGEMVVDNWDDLLHSDILKNWDDYYKKFLGAFGEAWFNNKNQKK